MSLSHDLAEDQKYNNMQKIYKLFIATFLLQIFCLITGCIPHIHTHSHTDSDVHSHSEFPIRYYSPQDNFDEYLANLGKDMPDYYIFDRIKGSQDAYRLEKEFISVSTTDSLIVSYSGGNQCTFNLPYKRINIIDVYKIKLDAEEKIVLEWNNREATGTAIGYVNFTIFDTEKCLNNTVSSYNGRISCFTDLNNDGRIDYIKVTDNFYDLKSLPEETWTNVYELSFIDLRDDTQMRAPIIVIDCSNYFVTVTEEEILHMTVAPCEN